MDDSDAVSEFPVGCVHGTGNNFAQKGDNMFGDEEGNSGVEKKDHCLCLSAKKTHLSVHIS